MAENVKMDTIQAKHKGARNELAGICWLLDQGYEVYRNVSQHGAIDIVAIRDGEISYIDVKARIKTATQSINGYSTKEHIDRGVLILLAHEDGSFSLMKPTSPELLICVACNTAIDRKRRAKATLYCTTKCERDYNKKRRSDREMAGSGPASTIA